MVELRRAPRWLSRLLVGLAWLTVTPWLITLGAIAGDKVMPPEELWRWQRIMLAQALLLGLAIGWLARGASGG